MIVAHSLEKPLTPDENRAFRAYVQGGGHLLLIAQAHSALFRDLPPEETAWTGIRRVAWQRQGAPCKALQPESAWLAGVFEERPDPAWLNARFLATPLPDGMRPVIGTDAGASLVGLHRFGAGWVAFLGHELFRMRPPQDDSPEDRPAWIRLLANLVDDANPLREGVYHEALYEAAATADAVWFWTREWQQGETYGPRFDPPIPSAEERVTTLSADLALDEFELLQLNLTPLQPLGPARLSFASATFPAARAHLFVQDRPDPIPWKKNPAIAREAPYWLMPPEAVEPRGSTAFATAPRETRILWIKLDSYGMAPGDHAAALHLDFVGDRRFTLPLAIRVHPVRIPRQRLIKLMPGGANYGDVRNAAPARRFMRNLAAHGFEWSILNVVRPADARLRGQDGTLDAAQLRQCRDRLAAGDLPALDFPAYDEWIEQSIEHGQTCFRAGDLSGYLRSALHRAGIPPNEWPPIEQWFCREFARTLREKGVRIMIASSGDELSRTELLERYIPWAQRMAEAGWGCSSSFTGIQHADPELNRLLQPYVKLWTLNRGLALLFTEGLRSGALAVRPDAIVGTYGAGEGRGTEIRKTPAQSRFLGWESWKLGIRNCMPNPYFKGWLYYVDYGDRGIAGERFVAYLDRNDPEAPLLNSPFLEGIREGIEDGNLCSILDWYLDRMPASPLTAAVRTRRDRIMAQDAGALLPWRIVEGANRLRHLVIHADSATYRAAKREVLDCLGALQQEALAAIRPSLYWHDIPLLKNGTPAAAIHAGTDCDTTELARTIRTLCGENLPLFEGADALDPRYPVAIVLGSGSQNPLAKTLLAGAQEDDATHVHPGPGHYFIKEIRHPGVKDGTVLIVAGPDAEGTAKGIRLFSRFLRSEGAWLLMPSERMLDTTAYSTSIARPVPSSLPR